VSTALHAQRIVDAWDGFNYTRFESELESALMACQCSVPCSEMESEEQSVLESVVRRLRQFPAVGDHDDQHWFEAGVQLLRHLRTR
jgi:predicted secreted Zn-dependent protease